MKLAPYYMPTEMLNHAWFTPDTPLVLIDLASADPACSPLHLPPVPVIGIGDEAHPLAAQMDMIVATNDQARKAAENIIGNPHAAALLVQLLRQIEGCAPAHALKMESLAYSVLQGSAEHQAWSDNRAPAAEYPAGHVEAERLDDSLHIILQRPEGFNQIDRIMRDQLREYFELAAIDGEIKSIRLTGAGRCFSMGADLREFGTTRDPATAHQIRLATLPAHAIAACADRLEVHVQGACVGSGLEMAAFAARITASPKAWFQLPELVMGLIPGAGGCVSLSRRIGRAKAAQMILSAERISAQTALAWGLVDALIED